MRCTCGRGPPGSRSRHLGIKSPGQGVAGCFFPLQLVSKPLVRARGNDGARYGLKRRETECNTVVGTEHTGHRRVKQQTKAHATPAWSPTVELLHGSRVGSISLACRAASTNRKLAESQLIGLNRLPTSCGDSTPSCKVGPTTSGMACPRRPSPACLCLATGDPVAPPQTLPCLWEQIRHRHLDGWRPTDGDVALFDPAAVTVTRYCYRDAVIPSRGSARRPWSRADRRVLWRAGCGESRTSGSAGGDGETRG